MASMAAYDQEFDMDIDPVVGPSQDVWEPHQIMSFTPAPPPPKPKAAFMPSVEATAFPPDVPNFDPPVPPPPPKFDEADPYSLPVFSKSARSTPAPGAGASTGNEFFDFDFSSGATTLAEEVYDTDALHSLAVPTPFVDPFENSYV